MSEHRLRKLFTPRSVAIVGASDRSGWSHRIRGALTGIGYAGDVYYVNPRGGTAHGAELHRSVEHIGTVPDLVYVMVPAAAALASVTDAARIGVKAAIVLSSGFAEIGEEGRREQRRMARVVREHGMVLLGPNTLGFVNPTRRIALMPMHGGDPPASGGIGVVSQSGAMAVQVMNMARSFDVGLSLLVSTGNEMDVGVADVIDYLVRDDHTKVIAVFLESVRDPSAFRRACVRAHRAGKPVVALKVGRSAAAARAALAHTGSLVGDDGIISAAFAASGVIRVNSLEDLLTTADTFVRSGPIGGRNLAITAISGGACNIAADRAEDVGLRVPTFTDGTLSKLRELLPEYATPQNPLDVTGAAAVDSSMFAAALEIVTADPGVDVAVAIGEIEHHAPEGAWGLESITAMTGAAAKAPVPAVFTNTTVRAISQETREIRRRLRVPSVFGGVDRVLLAIERIAEWSARPLAIMPPVMTGREDLPAPKVGVWSEATCRGFLESHGIPVVPATVASTPEHAASAAVRLGVPVALKIVSPDIIHKSDVGGVALDLGGHDEVLAAARRMLRDVAAKAPDARIEGLLVSPMRRGGHDLLVGVVGDADWGQVLAVAMGGVWTEVVGDVRRIALPCERAMIESALRSLRAAPVLLGARGTAAVDMTRLSATIARIADLGLLLGDELAAFEVNPLRITPDRMEALDATIVWKSAPQLRTNPR
jgi:acetate---CoA ligase (ADP-forming)